MESYEELTGYTNAELIAIFNAGREHVATGKQWYLDELVRRRADRATAALVRLTAVLAVLTVVLVALGAIGLYATVHAG